MTELKKVQKTLDRVFGYLNNQNLGEHGKSLLAEIGDAHRIVENLTIPVVSGSTFFKVTFRYDTTNQGRSVWSREEKTFDVNTSDELDSKIKAYIMECTTRRVNRRYYMQKTKVEKM